VNMYGSIAGGINKNIWWTLENSLMSVIPWYVLTKSKKTVIIILKYRLAESNQGHYKGRF
jgi:hypothetical protein